MGLAVGALFLQIVTTTLSVFDHVVPIKRHLGYTFRYKSKLEKLNEEVRQLGVERETLQHSVDEVLRQGNEIHNFVIDWQTRADTTIQEASRFLQAEEEEAKKRCFLGVCSNLKRRYLLGKKADEDASCIAKFKEEKDRFSQIFYCPPLPQIVQPPVPGYTAQSREELLKEVIKKLVDPNVDKVGVYGMGGIGKTTLAIEVHSQATRDKLFDVVVMTTVTVQPEIRKIQGEIADVLRLKFEEETEAGRASRLHKSLKETRTLLILDDLWSELKLEKIGIPTATMNDNSKGCKILLTSRNLDVLSAMDSICNFKVEDLSKEEAMSLFQKKVVVVEDPKIAEEILLKCHGFPLLIVTMAGLLRNKPMHTWKDSLTQLSRFDNQELQQKVYSVVELSYDRLVSEETKLIFLLSGICPQFGTTILDLLKYCWGLGLFKHYTLEKARNRLNKLIDDLIASSLLLEVDKRGYMKMHDTVREVAISIACRHQHAFKVLDGEGLKEWPSKDELSNCTKISMPLCDIQELPEDLECPLVEFFLLFLKGRSLNVPDSAFQHTKNLKVLHFKGMKFSSVPGSFCFLTNLHTLCLDGCHFCNVSIVGELKKLEILSFRGSNLETLPDEIGQLTKLKLLDLSHCSKLKVIPANVLSKLSALEELLIRNSFNQWEAQEHHNRSHASLTDLECLSQLTTFEVHVPDAKALTGALFSKKLERYQILVGHGWEWDEKNESSKTMKLKLNTSIELLPAIKKLLKKTETLELDQTIGVWSIFYDPENGGFPRLKKLYAQGDSEVQHIIDCSKMVINGFPVLESLELHHFSSLVKICHGEPASMSFSKLRKLVVCDCKNLKYLFSISMVRSLSQLEEIALHRCHNMDGIVVDESDGSEVEFPRLHKLSLNDLPKLKGFALDAKSFSISETALGYDTIELGTPLQLLDKMYSMVITTGFPDLESLELHNLASLAKICHGEPTSKSFGKLRKLVVFRCNKLKYLFSISMVRSISQLEEINVRWCENMEGIIVDESANYYYGNEVVELPRLRDFTLGDLPQLKRFALQVKSFSTTEKAIPVISKTALGYQMGGLLPLFDETVSFPSLEKLQLRSIDNIENIWHNRFATTGSFSKLTSLSIYQCTKLKSVFPSDSLRRFQKLKSLLVWRCNLVEEISKFEELDIEEPNCMITLELRKLDLQYLPKLKHIWREENTRPYFTLENLESTLVGTCELMKYLFPPCVAKRLPKLEVLRIWSCGELKEIIKGEECGGSTSSPCFLFPQLTRLELLYLPEIRSFYPGPHTTECPKLIYLRVIGCDKAFSKKEICGEWQNIPRQQHFLLSDEVFSNLENMSIDSLIFKMILQSPSPMKLPMGLKSLVLRSFRGRSLEISTSGVGLRLPNLQNLCVRNSSLKELFRYRRVDGDERDTDTRPCSPIKSLELYYVEGLRHILRQDGQMDPLLPYLETMELQVCKDLISLSPLSSASFWNLTTLIVWNCGQMTNLMKPSTAKTMTRVVEMRIYECVALKEIVLSEDDQDSNDLKTQEEIIFNKLATLELIKLESLTGFCTNDSVSFKFPSLENVTIEGCSNMRIFCHGELNAPKLENINSVGSDHSMVNWQWEGDLNSTVRQLYEEMVGLQWHSEIKLSRFPQLIERWHGGRLPFQHICRNLNNLAVDKCAIFSIAVPSSLLPFSNKLTKLVVEKCELVEDVFDLEGLNATEGHVALMSQLWRLHLFDLPKLRHIWNEDPHGILGIRNLTELKVHNCGSLTNILTLSMALGLDRLKWLEVTECALVEVIIKNGENELEWNQQTIFPLLWSIKLEHLPNLRNFCSGEHILKCPLLSRIYVVGCPKMSAYASTSSARKVDSSTSVHGQEDRPCEGSEVMPTLCFFNGKVEVRSLKELEVEWNSAMIEIWHQLFSAAFLSRLEVMKLIGFPDEPILLPLNFLHSCPNLKILVVGDSSCDSIFPVGKAVVEKNDLCSTAQLVALHLFNLPKLTYVVEEEFMLLLSQHLESLEVIKCDGLKQLVPYNASFQNLETLKVSQCNGLTSLISHSIARSLVKLENMIVKECNTMRAIVASEGHVLECDVDFSHLKHLELYSLPCLTSFSIGNGAFNFQDLKTLEVSQCKGLRSLLSHSIAKGLVKLEKMIVKECDTMRAIVASEGEDVVCDVDFGCLKHLELCHLPCLTSFSFGNVAFNFPYLGDVIIKKCPNMKIFCNTIISTPMLDEVQVADDEDGWRWEGSLNGTIAKLFTEMTINQ